MYIRAWQIIIHYKKRGCTNELTFRARRVCRAHVRKGTRPDNRPDPRASLYRLPPNRQSMLAPRTLPCTVLMPGSAALKAVSLAQSAPFPSAIFFRLPPAAPLLPIIAAAALLPPVVLLLPSPTLASFPPP